MKFCSRILAIAIIASTCGILGCAAPSTFSYQNVALTLTAQCFDCNGGVQYSVTTPTTILMPGGGGTGGCVEFIANVTNAPATPTWTLYPTPNLTDPSYATGTTFPVTVSGSQVGTVATPSGNTNFFCAPSSAPVYSGPALLQAQSIQYTVNGVAQTGIPQGDILLAVSVPADPANPSNVVTAYQLFQMITGISVRLSPATPTGQTTSAVSIPRGTTYQFNGYAVGAPPCSTTCVVAPNPLNPFYPNGITYPTGTTINTVIWEVGPAGGPPVIGGSPAQGTITATGLYTAPATPPAVQSVVTMFAQTLVTATSTAYVTIQ